MSLFWKRITDLPAFPLPGPGLTLEVLNRAIAQRGLLRKYTLNKGRAAAAQAAASLLYIYTLFLPIERGTAVDLALWQKRTSEGGPWLLGVSKTWRQPGLESHSDQGREAKRSVGHGGGLEVWGGGLWSAAEGRLQAPWSSGRDRRCGWADGLRGLSRDGSKE